ncbi:MAG: glycosyltransferase family 2 protein [Pseudomonadales bacterium]|nr:glycosyltransferase family 2 protein [Pseudomonadales bacterium]
MLSVVLATYNEEKNILKYLSSDSIRKIADEIIVVDGYSSDQTREVCEKLSAKVIKTTNKKNFHINKQMGLDMAKGDLVLQLDADEVCDKNLVKFVDKLNKKIQVIKNNNESWETEWKANNPVAWEIPRKNLFLGAWLKKGGQYPDPVIRLYINGFAKLPQKDVHEQMVVDGTVGWAKGHLLHYANPTFSDYLRKFGTYTNFKAHQLNEKGLQINIFNTMKYMVYLPLKTFLMMFLRHKGFVDGIPGFVFAIMSGMHHAIAYLLLWEIKENRKYKKND